MSTAAMTERIKEPSLRLMARITGTLYLITIVTGIFSAGYVSGLVGRALQCDPGLTPLQTRSLAAANQLPSC